METLIEINSSRDKLMKALLFVLSFLLCLSAPACSAQKDPPPREPLEPTSFWRAIVLQDSVSFGSEGERKQVPVLAEKFTIEGSEELPEFDFPFPGLLLVHLLAGELTTIINDERVERSLGDFWVVPPGTKMGVKTEDDKAIFATYLIGEEYLAVAPGRPLVSETFLHTGRFRELRPNLFSREAYRIGDPNSPIAKVMDFNVGPGRRAEAYSFDGAALLQVTSGEGLLIVDGKETNAQLGASLAASDGQELIVDNSRADKPLKIRAVVWQK